MSELEDATLRKNANLLLSFTCMVLRWCKEPIPGYPLIIDPYDSDRAKQLESLISHNKVTILDVHQFIFPFFSKYAPRFGDGDDKWKHPMEHFYMLYFLHHDGTFANAHYITSPLSGIRYICRAVVYFEGLQLGKEGDLLQ